VAEIGQVLGGRHNGRNQFTHAEESILENQAADVCASLILGNETDTDSATQTLPIHDDLVVPGLHPVAEIVERRLRVNVQARLVGLAGGDAVAAVFEHEDIATGGGDQHACNGQAMANVASVAVEHQHRHVRVRPAARAPDVEGRQFLAIVGRNDKLLVVSEVELVRAGNVGAGVCGDVGRIN
jgi:hypothetical protein